MNIEPWNVQERLKALECGYKIQNVELLLSNNKLLTQQLEINKLKEKVASLRKVEKSLNEHIVKEKFMQFMKGLNLDKHV